MNINIYPILAALTVLLTITSVADEASDVAISKIAAPKRSAVFQLSTKQVHSFGVFISEDGHALVHLQALATKEKPKVLLADGTISKFDSVLGIFPKEELALLKIRHAPELWLELASVEPKINEAIALLPLKTDSPWDKTIPPVVGPIMAKRSEVTANLQDIQFVKIMSLGSGLSPAQRRALGPGRFAVNGAGKLVAFTAGTSKTGPQTLIHLAPIVHLGARITELAEGGQEIVFPLPAAKNPVDRASLDPDFHPKNVAKTRGDWAEFQRLMVRLHRRYPQSPLIMADLVVLADPNLQKKLPEKFDTEVFLKTLKVDPAQTKAHQVACLSAKSEVLMLQGRFDEAIEVVNAAIAISPGDYPKGRVNLASILAQSGDFAEAEKLARELYLYCSDSWDVVQILGFSVVRQGKPDMNPDTRKRLRELAKIYGIR